MLSKAISNQSNSPIVIMRQPIRQPQKEEIAQTPQNRRFFEKDVVPAGIEPASKV